MDTTEKQKTKKIDNQNPSQPGYRDQKVISDKEHGKNDVITFTFDEDNWKKHVIAKTEGSHRFYAKAEKALPQVSFDWNDDSRGFDLVTVIRRGIHYRLFRKVAEDLPLSDADWASFLDTTKRTLERYRKDNKKFSPKQTETIIEIKQLMRYGEEVFGDIPNFHRWLLTDNIALGGAVPKDLLDTSVGLGMVKDELGRIDYGIFV